MSPATVVSFDPHLPSFVASDDRSDLHDALASIGVRFRPGVAPGELTFATSRLPQVVAGLARSTQVRLVVERAVQLACSDPCLSAHANSRECRCRCLGAFHAAGVAPPGVVVDDGDGDEFEVRVELLFDGGRDVDPGVVLARLHAALHEQAVELASVMS